MKKILAKRTHLKVSLYAAFVFFVHFVVKSLRKSAQSADSSFRILLHVRKQLRPSVESMFDGEKEARLIVMACGPKPQGRARWTLELLADRVVALKIV
ncbi:MAG: hypothetical protein HY287_07965, partial [Planctomycetes bacterium]|nr:hypothetical protein [Planctomycetota bacterium]MBI3834248.1 hypothetical protein [Planctomycetota bacterium]